MYSRSGRPREDFSRVEIRSTSGLVGVEDGPTVLSGNDHMRAGGAGVSSV